MSIMDSLSVKVVPIGELIPYGNNPRSIPQDAIEAVATSIQQYGWQAPIVVDKDNVIVVGHTRRLAALKLGLTEVPVTVTNLSEEKANEYRLVDNRTSEMSGWDHDALIVELREFEEDLLKSFFPEIDLEANFIETASVPSQAELDWAESKAKRIGEATGESQHLTEIVCPSCFHSFKVRTRSLPGASGEVLEELLNGKRES